MPRFLDVSLLPSVVVSGSTSHGSTVSSQVRDYGHDFPLFDCGDYETFNKTVMAPDGHPIFYGYKECYGGKVTRCSCLDGALNPRKKVWQDCLEECMERRLMASVKENGITDLRRSDVGVGL